MGYATGGQLESFSVICQGNYGPGGFVPSPDDELQVIGDRFIVGGVGEMTAVTSHLEAGTPPEGGGRVGDVALDGSTLLHLVTVPPEEIREAWQSLSAFDMQQIDVRVTSNEARIGGLDIEFRVVSSSEETAQQLHGLLVGIILGAGAELEGLGVSSAQIQSWISLEGQSVVVRPGDEGLGLIAAISIPAFLQYIKRAKAAEAEINLPVAASSIRSYYVLHESYPPSAGPTPATVPCGDGVESDPSWWQVPGWSDIHFFVEGHQYYSYELVNEGTRAIIRARGDLDCDGIQSTYELVVGPALDLGPQSPGIQAVDPLE